MDWTGRYNFANAPYDYLIVLFFYAHVYIYLSPDISPGVFRLISLRKLPMLIKSPFFSFYFCYFLLSDIFKRNFYFKSLAYCVEWLRSCRGNS
ncbi:hypothetical protein F4677DRAFT_318990 [Hypoxylon crocopeplum]|nr:hypothetical protein F4677DRAFT_318990 [Hypoxylon crocopeplum]